MKRIAGCLAVFVLAAVPGVAKSSTMEFGDLLAPSVVNQTLYRVDPLTGHRSVISSSQSSTRRGAGPGFQPVAVSVSSTGQIFVLDRGNQAVLEVDAVTGDRSYVSRSRATAVGSGPAISILATQMTLSLDGELVISNDWQTLLGIDPASGDRRHVSSYDHAVGSGPNMQASGVGIDVGGDLLVPSVDDQTLYRVDPLTGDRSIISSSQSSTRVGAGPGFQPVAVSVSSTGQIFVLDPVNQGVLEVDAVTGDRSYVSRSQATNVGSGPAISRLATQMTLSLDGELVISNGWQTLLGVDPVSGDRRLVSSYDLAVGSGPNMHASGIALFVPEPSTVTLLGMGALGLLVYVWRRRAA